ncbi:MAG TPA: response regulator transcription factor [Anaerolineae bacterium]|nr:response regulator transcription factor [Anaerolineae bacterium]
MSKTIRLVIANSDPLFVDRLATSLHPQWNIQVVGTAFDGPGAIETCADTLPDVVLLSLYLPGVDGVKAAKSILDTNAQTGILIVASPQANSANEYALQALKIGAKGYLPASTPLTTVAQAIQQVYEGDVYLPSELASLLLSEFDRLP